MLLQKIPCSSAVSNLVSLSVGILTPFMNYVSVSPFAYLFRIYHMHISICRTRFATSSPLTKFIIVSLSVYARLGFTALIFTSSVIFDTLAMLFIIFVVPSNSPSNDGNNAWCPTLAFAYVASDCSFSFDYLTSYASTFRSGSMRCIADNCCRTPRCNH